MSKLSQSIIVAGALACAGFAVSGRTSAQETPPHLTPVKVVAPQRLSVVTSNGVGQMPLHVSVDWSVPRPDIRRAVLVFHGILRNADVYYRDSLVALAEAGEAGAGTMMIAPQFLADFDIPAHKLPQDTLAWDQQDWPAGAASLTAAKASSYDAIDAILVKLSDRSLFPNLAQVVVAGHSGGGQIVQRYAVVGKADTALTALGVKVRYVVANPSSYVYFVPERPGSDGTLVPFAGRAACPHYNDWRYGFSGSLPAYVDHGREALEQRYMARDVVHLLGTDDTDPNHRVLDNSCAGKAEGPHRYARGHAFFAGMQTRHGTAYRHRLYDVRGVGHHGGRMFGSSCGLFALFDKPGCGAS